MAAIETPSNDKPFVISQIKAYVPITLDMGKLNYDTWRELFKTHCSSFSELGHIDGTSRPSSAADKTWKEHDDLVKMWIYGTISESILETVLKPKCSARDLWTAIEALFRDNKEARAMQLENDLRSTLIGDLSVHDYCKKIKSIADLLANIDSPVSDKVLVMHILNGLSEKYDSIINVIKHKTPFPGFIETRSMLQMEEERLAKQIKTSASNNHTPSSPAVLYTSSNFKQRNNGTDNNNNNNHGGFQRGNYNNHGRGRGGRNNRGRGRYNNNCPPHNFQAPWPLSSGQYHWPRVYSSGFNYPMGPALPYSSHQNMMQPGLLGPSPSRTTGEAHMAHDFPPPSTVSPQTMLPASITHAFNTMALHDPNQFPWYMDTTATNHITSHPGSPHSDQTTPM